MELIEKIKKIQSLRLPSINLKFTSVKVEAKTRAIRCEWTREMYDDLLNMKQNLIYSIVKIKLEKYYEVLNTI